MGAFGRLLDSYFGGTIHDVKTWGNTEIIKKKKLRCSCGKFAKKLWYLPGNGGKWECSNCKK